MTDHSQLFQAGLKFHMAGNLQQAEQAYRQILQDNPNHPGALHYLGVIAHQVGQNDAAIQYISAALALCPSDFSAHANLGEAYRALGRLDDALACYQRALDIKPDNAPALNNMGIALQSQGKFSQGEQCYRQALSIQPNYPEAHHNLGNAVKEQGRLEEAEACYREALRHGPNYALAHNSLGVLLLEQERHGEALASLQQALALRPDYAEAHYNLGLLLRTQGKLTGAESRFREALRLKPDLLLALSNLGAVLLEQGKTADAEVCFQQALSSSLNHVAGHLELARSFKRQGKVAEAVACLRRAIEVQPHHAGAHFQLGICLQEQGQLAEAESLYRRVAELQPDHTEALNNLGAIYLEEGRLNEAQACFEQVIKLRPDHAGAHNNLGVLFLQEERLVDAEPYFRKALQLKPDYTAALNNLAQVLQGLGQLDEARACYQESLALTGAQENVPAPDRGNSPDQPASTDGPAIVIRRQGASFHDAVRIKAALALPVIMDSHEQILWHRQRLESEVERLLNENLLVEDPVRQVGITPFYLAYHGLNDRDLMAKIAAMFIKAAPSLNYVAPHCKSSSAGTLPKGNRVRIGFISRYFYDHTIGRLFGSIPRLLSRKEFEVFLFRFPGHDDPIARTIQEGADTVVALPPRLDQARRMIAEQRLDILFYTDIGMEPLTYFLAFARLAPVQCVTWGHPVTSGIPTTDYFISSVDLETDQSDGYYTEKLVRLPRLSVHYERPRAPKPLKDRSAFGLPSDAHLYACPQSLFKFHPDFDEILAGILQQDPKGILVLIEGQQPYWTQVLQNRFNRTLPEVQERIRFLPRLSKEDFLSLLANSDVLLDPVHFGGGNSSYEGLGLEIPVVTLPSPFLRGRLTYAMYKQMGLANLIASDSSHYIRLANQIACEPQFRTDQRRQICEDAGRCLFEDVSAFHDLNNWLAKLTKAESGNAMTRHSIPQRPFPIVETPMQHHKEFIRFRSFDTPLGRRVCQQIFSGQTYPLLQLDGPVGTILDIGANVGAATVYFALTYPTARIFAFEPDPACVELLRWNCQALPNVTIFPYGLADREANVLLYLGEQDSVANSVRSSAEATATYVPVDLRKASAVLTELGLETVDILKVDTEGCEVPILESLAAWLPRIGLIYLEYHSADDRISIDRMLVGSHLLCRGRITNPHRGDLCYVARERLPGQGGAVDPWRIK